MTDCGCYDVGLPDRIDRSKCRVAELEEVVRELVAEWKCPEWGHDETIEQCPRLQMLAKVRAVLGEGK